ncbi:hypothetical protein GCM10027321_44680 [Massilia terrae]
MIWRWNTRQWRSVQSIMGATDSLRAPGLTGAAGTVRDSMDILFMAGNCGKRDGKAGHFTASRPSGLGAPGTLTPLMLH